MPREHKILLTGDKTTLNKENCVCEGEIPLALGKAIIIL